MEDIKPSRKNKPGAYYLVNAITMYRLVSAPLLLWLAYVGYHDLFIWLITFSFFTDAIDGPISRKYKVTSLFGAKLDSVADDATVVVATVALWFVHPDFIKDHWHAILIMVGFLLVQMIAALIAYGKLTSFHTYLAKTAAVAQALFFFTIYFETPLVEAAFYLAIGLSIVQQIEDIIIVIIEPEWRANVKGLYWVLKEKKRPARRRKAAMR
jgi:phosphatidylglycerophosphate synthase